MLHYLLAHTSLCNAVSRAKFVFRDTSPPSCSYFQIYLDLLKVQFHQIYKILEMYPTISHISSCNFHNSLINPISNFFDLKIRDCLLCFNFQIYLAILNVLKIFSKILHPSQFSDISCNSQFLNLLKYFLILLNVSI